jgi:hypothetical protein
VPLITSIDNNNSDNEEELQGDSEHIMDFNNKKLKMFDKSNNFNKMSFDEDKFKIYKNNIDDLEMEYINKIESLLEENENLKKQLKVNIIY